MNSRTAYNLGQKWLMMLPYRGRRLIRERLAEWMPKPDCFLISYPKSGRTWLRLMIGAAAIDHLKLPPQDPTDLHGIGTLSSQFPTIQVTHDAQSTNISLRRIKFRPGVYSKSRVIFLCRDPRDVLASSFYDQKYRRIYDPDLPEFADADEMVEAPMGGLPGILRFYNIWAENLPRVRNYLLVFYEDLKADPARELRRCLDFLGLADASDQSILEGVARGEFKTMRDAEREGKFQSNMPPPDPANVNTYKVRKGMVGGYVDDFSAAAIARMDDIIADELSDLFGRYKYRTKAKVETVTPAV
jgi:hypothetical protein